METTIPVAFRVAAKLAGNVEREARISCRDIFEETRLLARIVDDIEDVLNVPGVTETTESEDFDGDPALPGHIWDPETGEIKGGVNFGEGTAGEERGGSGSRRRPAAPL